MTVSILAVLSLGFLLPHIISAVDQDANSSLVAQLRSSNTALDRQSILANDTDWVYDYTKSTKYTFDPGSVVNANVATFPAMAGTGLTLALLNLGPCAMLPPHFHRATNVVVAVEGSTDTYMIQENGARVVHTTLTPGMMTIFPRASMHTMVNNGCTNAQLVSALNDEDAATMNVANNFFLFPEVIVSRILGDLCDFNKTSSDIPPIGTGSNSGLPDCLARCQLQGTKVRKHR